MMSLKNSIKKGLEAPEDNWLISYADMMTLLTFLFIILYAMAAQKQGIMKTSAAAVPTASAASVSAGANKNNSNIDYAYYYIDKNSSSSPSSKITSKSSASASKSSASKASTGKSSTKKSSTSKSSSGKSSASKSSSGKPTYTEVETFLARNSLTNKVSLRQNETGIIFNIQAEVLFDEKSAKLRPESYSILNRISSYINTLDNDVIIAGHTDNQPINSDQYQSSWELSCDRAAKVLRYFTDTKSLNPERFQAVGYGSYRPIADNKTSSGRQRNRRVEIIIVKVS
ncbi:MAG TPA: OmpA family protein [Caproiciproducens sp.]|nr:OmpA family protein [Caproiciproducens sp.]